MTADMNNKDSLAAACHQVSRMVIVTPTAENRAELAVNAVEAAAAANVDHVVLVSALTADYTNTIFGSQMSAIEQSLKASGLAYTIVRLPMFFENYALSFASMAEGKVLRGCLDGDALHNGVAVEDVGELIANILIWPEMHIGSTLSVTGRLYTENDAAEAFGASWGVPITYEQVPADNMLESLKASGVPEWLAKGIMELYQLIERGSELSQSNQVFESVVGREPMSIVDFAKKIPLPRKDAPPVSRQQSFNDSDNEEEEDAKGGSRELSEEELSALMQEYGIANREVFAGGWAQKKMSNESKYQKRWVWIDASTRSLHWSKVEGKAVSKSIPLSQCIITDPVTIAATARRGSIFGGAAAQTAGLGWTVCPETGTGVNLKMTDSEVMVKDWITVARRMT